MGIGKNSSGNCLAGAACGAALAAVAAGQSCMSTNSASSCRTGAVHFWYGHQWRSGLHIVYLDG